VAEHFLFNEITNYRSFSHMRLLGTGLFLQLLYCTVTGKIIIYLFAADPRHFLCGRSGPVLGHPGSGSGNGPASHKRRVRAHVRRRGDDRADLP
jgi:hypothetical protein